MRERYERIIKDCDQEEAAFAIRALFRGDSEDDPEASLVGSLLFGRLILGLTRPPE